MRLWIVTFALCAGALLLAMAPTASAAPGDDACPKDAWNRYTPPSWALDAMQGGCFDGFVVDPDDCICMIMFRPGSCGR